MSARLDRRMALATGGLFFAWAAHDLEEWVTMTPSTRDSAAALTDRLPTGVTLPSWVRDGMSQRHVNTALAIMAGVFAAGSVAGYRSGGRSRFYQFLLYGLGAHTFIHLGGAAFRGGYTSGVVSAPFTALPFWLWARRVLRDHDVPDRVHPLSILAFFPILGAVHGLTALLVDRRRVARPAGDRDRPAGTGDELTHGR